MSRARQIADLGSPAASGLSNRNLIINGAMNIAQRGTVASATNGTYGGPDRFAINESGDLVVTLSQDTDVPTGNGFLNSMKVDVTTADSSLAAGDYAFLGHKFEGQNLQRLKKGTSNAESVTLSFWVKSTITGTYIIQLYDNDNARHISKSYTVSSANTWEHKTLTFAGDTSGALDDDNAYSLQVYWWLAAGSTYTSGTLATSWASFTAANAAAGQVNAINSTDNNFYLTGVQLEVGDVATAFEHEDYGTTLAKCHRYCYVAPQHIGYTGSYTNVSPSGTIQFPTNMRAAPTVTGTFTPQSGNAGTFAIASINYSYVFVWNSANNWSAGIGIVISDFKADIEL
jgi:hypothetical protein